MRSIKQAPFDDYLNAPMRKASSYMSTKMAGLDNYVWRLLDDALCCAMDEGSFEHALRQVPRTLDDACR